MYKWLANINTKDYIRYRYATMRYNEVNTHSKVCILKKGLNEAGAKIRGKYTMFCMGNEDGVIEQLEKYV